MDSQELARNISSKMKQLREANGISKTNLAELVGVSTKTITAWETGTTIPQRAQKLIKLADALQITIDELVGRNRMKKDEDSDRG